jgi:hypothetical protein
MSKTKDRISELLRTDKPLNAKEEYELSNLVFSLDEDDNFRIAAYAAMDQMVQHGLLSS